MSSIYEFKAKIVNIGNSRGFIVPSEILKTLNVSEGQDIIIMIRDGGKKNVNK